MPSVKGGGAETGDIRFRRTFAIESLQTPTLGQSPRIVNGT